MIIRSSSSLWEWGKTFSLFPQCLKNVNPAYGEPNYSHKKLQICPILKKLDTIFFLVSPVIIFVNVLYKSRTWVTNTMMSISCLRYYQFKSCTYDQRGVRIVTGRSRYFVIPTSFLQKAFAVDSNYRLKSLVRDHRVGDLRQTSLVVPRVKYESARYTQKHRLLRIFSVNCMNCRPARSTKDHV